MALKDILVGVDPSTAGEGRLKLALNLVRPHKAHITACYIMREEHAAPSPIMPGVPVSPGPGDSCRAPSGAYPWRHRSYPDFTGIA